VPAGYQPPPNWQPDPSWPPVPPGWPMWIADDSAPGGGLPAAPPVEFPYQAYAYGAPPPKARTNGFAITAFVLGLIGGTILGIIFGIISLVQIRRNGQRGRGLAIAGIVFSCIWLVIGVAIIASGGLSITPKGSAGGNSTGPIHSTRQINIYSLRPGDCFQNPPASQTTLGVTNVTAVPCTVAHNARAYAQFDATNASYPGSRALITEAQSGCQSRESVLNKSAITSTMTLHFLYPLPNSWAAGRRTITCLVVGKTKDLTSSLMAG
jgi:Domain of unknown function (DUF4190)/Septum formation